MFAFDVLDRCGTAAFLRMVAALVLVAVLHLARIPLVLLARVLEGVMARLADAATRAAVTTPRGPINHYVTPVVRPVARAPRGQAAPVMGGAK